MATNLVAHTDAACPVAKLTLPHWLADDVIQDGIYQQAPLTLSQMDYLPMRSMTADVSIIESGNGWRRCSECSGQRSKGNTITRPIFHGLKWEYIRAFELSGRFISLAVNALDSVETGAVKNPLSHRRMLLRYHNYYPSIWARAEDSRRERSMAKRDNLSQIAYSYATERNG